MGLLSWLAGTPKDPQEEYIAELRAQPLNWERFAERLDMVLFLAGRLPWAEPDGSPLMSEFSDQPSPESFVRCVNDKTAGEAALAVDASCLLLLPALEASIDEVIHDLRRSPGGDSGKTYLMCLYMLTDVVSRTVQVVPPQQRLPMSQYVFAYLAARAGSDKVVPPDVAVRWIAEAEGFRLT